MEKGELPQGHRKRHIEDWLPVPFVLEHALKLLCLWERGKRNAAQLDITHNLMVIDGLPHEMSGLRILHLSDLHLRSEARFFEALLQKVSGLS